jgi:hypothetical protein
MTTQLHNRYFKHTHEYKAAAYAYAVQFRHFSRAIIDHLAHIRYWQNDCFIITTRIRLRIDSGAFL